jgi:hypothetical protein
MRIKTSRSITYCGKVLRYYELRLMKIVPEPDPQPQWRRVAMSGDGKLVAMVTSEGDVYIINHLGSLTFVDQHLT